MEGFKEGYEYFLKSSGSVYASLLGGEYVNTVSEEIKNLLNELKEYSGYNTATEQLKGNIAEIWHKGTYNIDAAVNGSKNRATALKSNKLGSVDIALDSGENYSLKYDASGVISASEQSKSIDARYKEYIGNKGTLTKEEYFKKHGYSEDVLEEALYKGQNRLIPSDQIEEAVAWLKYKIYEDSDSTPQQIHRYKETLGLLCDRIKDCKGNESIPLSEEDAKKLAELAKSEGIKPKEWGLTTEKLIKFKNILKQSFKAGLSSAIITAVIKAAPDLINAIRYLIDTGEIDVEDLKTTGLSAATGAAEGFLCGSICAAISAGCSSGLLGSTLKEINPSVVGVAVVIALETVKSAAKVAMGKMSRYELTNELVKNMFVSTCSLAFGAVSQCFIELPVFGFMIGSFIGSLVGSITYQVSYKPIISFCVDTGFTMFGLVKQDYQLPEEVLREIGIDVFEYEKFEYDRFECEKFEFEQFTYKPFEYEKPDIVFLRRGVIGVSKIGYIQ